VFYEAQLPGLEYRLGLVTIRRYGMHEKGASRHIERLLFAHLI
jgi:hypothetical protein